MQSYLDFDTLEQLSSELKKAVARGVADQIQKLLLVLQKTSAKSREDLVKSGIAK